MRHQVEVQLVVGKRAVLHHYVVHAPLDLDVAVVADQPGHQPVPIPADPCEPPGQRDGDVVLGEGPQVRRRVRASDVGCERPLRRDELHRRPATRQQLGSVERRLGTVVVEDQDAAVWVDCTGHHVPGVAHQAFVLAKEGRVRDATRGDDHHIGVLREHGHRVGEGTEPELDTGVLGLRHPPVDDADQVTSAGRGRRQPHLATRDVGRLHHHHFVPSLAQHAGGLESSRTGAHHHDPAALPRGDRHVAQGLLAAGGGVVDALGVPGLVDRIEAVVRADARADPVLVARCHLGDQVRVGDLRARHANQVEQSVSECVSCRGDVRDPGGVHHRDLDRTPDLASELQERSRWRPHRGDDPRQGRVALDRSLDDRQEVDAVVDVPRQCPKGLLAP